MESFLEEYEVEFESLVVEDGFFCELGDEIGNLGVVGINWEVKQEMWLDKDGFGGRF